jgi:PAS domain S-box-containing protein
MSKATARRGAIPSLRRLFLRVMAIMLLTEAAIMLVLPGLPGGRDPLFAPLLDIALLTVTSAPCLWWFVVRPLRGAALHEHRRAATVIAHARDGIISFSRTGLVESFNPAAQRIFGYAADDVIGRPMALLMAERSQDAATTVRRFSGAWHGDRTLEVPGRRKDGTTFPMELSLTTSDAGEEALHTAIVRDVTARRHAEDMARTRTSQLEAVRIVAAEITRELDLRIVLDLITRRAAELFGVMCGSVMLWDEPSSHLRPQTWYGFDDRFKDLKVELGDGFAGVIAERRRGLIVHDCSMSSYAFPELAERFGRSGLLGQPLLYRERLLGVIILSNVGTDRPFTEQDLEVLGVFADQAAIAIENARLYEEIQSLAIVEERQRIAREMHDSLAQTLGLLHMQLMRLTDGNASVDLVPALREMASITEHAYDDLRQSMFGLRTMVSRNLGWVPTLTEYLHEFSTGTGIDIALAAGGDVPPRLPPVTEVQLIRIIQEALVNVLKHASATHATVRLDSEGGWIRVTVEDDGRGFAPETVRTTRPGHFGLDTMRERAEAVGGKLEIDSAPGRGTRIIATLPTSD